MQYSSMDLLEILTNHFQHRYDEANITRSNSNNNMFIVQYTIYSSMDLLEILTNHVQHRYDEANITRSDSNNNMFVVQYPIRFNGPPRNINKSCSAPLCAGEWWFN